MPPVVWVVPEVGEFFLLHNVMSTHRTNVSCSPWCTHPLIDTSVVKSVSTRIHLPWVHARHCIQANWTVLVLMWLLWHPVVKETTSIKSSPRRLNINREHRYLCLYERNNRSPSRSRHHMIELSSSEERSTMGQQSNKRRESSPDTPKTCKVREKNSIGLRRELKRKCHIWYRWYHTLFSNYSQFVLLCPYFNYFKLERHEMS